MTRFGLALVTGASGFLGRRLLQKLHSRTVSIRALTRDPDSLLELNGVERIRGDIQDLASLRQVLANVDVVFHLAGEKRVPARFLPVNVLGTQNMLAAAVAAGVKRFLHVSSVGVIGADPFCGMVFDEDAPCKPSNDYERSKWAAEKLAQDAGNDGLPVSILRPANIFGDRDPQQSLLALARTVSDGRFAYFGGRTVICNYVFVDDVAQACLVLAEHPNAVGRTYHLSDACTLGELVDALASGLGVARPRFELPHAAASMTRAVLRVARKLPLLPRSSLMARLISLYNLASFASPRLAEELGFECHVGWRAGLARVLDWYRSQGAL